MKDRESGEGQTETKIQRGRHKDETRELEDLVEFTERTAKYKDR